MKFPASSISEIDHDARQRLRIWQNVLGMFGPNGPLPLHLTELAWQRLHNYDDPTLTAFLNIFHHRMLSFFYRSRCLAEPALQFDRPEEDRFQEQLASLIGIGTDAFRDGDAMDDLVKLHFVGRLGKQNPDASGLAVILASYLKIPVEIEQFIGQWLPLPVECLNSIGRQERTTRLGVNATLGSHIWDRQHRFRIKVGPLSLADYERMLPGGSGYRRLNAVARNYVGDSLEWEIQLLLKQEEVPCIQLGVHGQLGWSDWTLCEPAQADRGDLRLPQEI